MKSDEIIKGFESCIPVPKCNNCPYRTDPRYCKDRMQKDVLDFIKSQQRKTEIFKISSLEDIKNEILTFIKDNMKEFINPILQMIGEEKDFFYHKVGDICIYAFNDSNKSCSIVEIIKILDDKRGIAEIKFHNVFVDDSGNGYFTYLLESGGTMNASFKYLKTIIPGKVEEC